MCNWFWKLGLMGALSVVLQAPVLTVSKQANAQVTSDSTLGGESSVIVPDVTIRDLPSERVDGGAIRGANLFHSFQEFNVGEGRGVYFSNPSAVENIFSRVTGANSSNILGRLGVLGNANLYLMNPNGIVFGQNASLDVEGSFVATTANAIKFGNTGLFSASEPASSNLLSINPSALFYNVLNNAEIVNRSQNGLNVNEGQSLLLVGGKVKLENGVIKAPGGRVELGGLNSPGDIAISQNSNNLGLSFPSGVDKADVSLTNASEVNVRSNGNGSIAVNAKDVDISSRSALRGGINSGSEFVGAVAGDITLNATGIIKVEQQGSIIENIVGAEAIGNGGNVNVNTGSLLVTGNAELGTITFGKGNAGNVTIDASEAVTINDGYVFSNVRAGGVGNGGDININARSLSLTNGGQVNAFVRAASNDKPAGVGKAGNTIIKVNDEFKIDGSNGKFTGVFNNLESGATGSSGNIDITTGSLLMTGDVRLVASTFGKGNAGGVTIKASEAINIDFGDIFSRVQEGAEGSGGEIKITAPKVSLVNDAQVSTSTYGKGNAGSITIDASEAVTFDSGDVFSTVEAGAVGNGGDIKITAGSLSLTNGGQINTFVRGVSDGKPAGVGNAGSTIIKVSDALTISGSSGKRSGIFNYLDSGTTGNAGNIDITTGSLLMTGDVRLVASTFGKGNAGGVIINATEAINIDSGYIFSRVQEGGEGTGGEIKITAPKVSLVNNAEISSNTYGKGNAGSVTIDASQAVTFDNSNIFNIVEAGAVGNGGDIKITAGSLSLINGGEISAFVRGVSDGKPAGVGNAGNTIIKVNDEFKIDGSSGKRSGIFNYLDSGATGSSGNIDITTGSLLMTGDVRLVASTFGKGNAGGVTINASEAINIDSGYIFSRVQEGGEGTGGEIKITAPKVSLVNDAQVSTSTYGKGNAGSITIDASEAVTFDSGDVFSTVEAGAVGNGGDIKITAGSLSLTNGGQINAFVRKADNGKSAGVGNAGNTIIKVNDEFKIDGSSGKLSGIFNDLESGTTGNAGKIDITTGSLLMTGDARLVATTSGKGNAGGVTIKASEAINIDSGYIFSRVGEGAEGAGGEIKITAPKVSLVNDAQVSTSTYGKGNAGSITIDASEAVTFDSGDVFSTVEAGAVGNGGDIKITAGSLSLTNGGQINAFVREADNGKSAGVGNAGNTIIKVNDEFRIDGSSGKLTGVFNDLESGTTGSAGKIDITTGSLLMTGNARLNSSTFGKGNAGGVTINAREAINIDSGYISSIVGAGAVGNGGDININARSLSLTNEGQINAFVRRVDDGKPAGVGNAGNTIIKVNDEFKISGSSGKFTGVFNDLENGTTGSAGNIDITTGSLSMVGDGGLSTGTSGNGNAGNINIKAKQISLSSNAYIESQSDSAGKAGNITITSGGIFSANDSRITTSALQSSGGTISIKAANIRLFGNSDITTNVENGAGGGGDITLTANSIIALGDSDILAFARDGQGGDVSFNTPAFFGQNYEPAQAGTDPSTLDGNNRVDINASGAVSGTISLPDTSFVQNSLSELPENVIDTGNLIANSCIARANSQQQGTFIITGSGALPSRPGDALMSQYTFGSIRTNNVSASNRRPWQKGDPIIEPHGAYRLHKGRLVLSRECG